MRRFGESGEVWAAGLRDRPGGRVLGGLYGVFRHQSTCKNTRLRAPPFAPEGPAPAFDEPDPPYKVLRYRREAPSRRRVIPPKFSVRPVVHRAPLIRGSRKLAWGLYAPGSRSRRPPRIFRIFPDSERDVTHIGQVEVEAVDFGLRGSHVGRFPARVNWCALKVYRLQTLHVGDLPH